MKRVLKTTLKIFIFVLLLFIPVTFFITFFSLSQRNIPLWNIGIRNILIHARNNYLPALFISYLVSTLLAISLIDKMKVRSLIALHLPALIVGVVLLGAFNLLEGDKSELSLLDRDLHLGYRTFFKEEVFNDIGGGSLFLKKADKNLYTLYLYDKNKNNLSIIHNVSMKKGSRNSLTVRQDKRVIILTYEEKKRRKSLQIPYDAFSQRKNITKTWLISKYVKWIKNALNSVAKQSKKLPRKESNIFLGSLLITLFMISIPLTYALNDGGWGFSGIMGVIVILVLLPPFYGYVLNALGGLHPKSGESNYLLPSMVFGAFGIFIMILVKALGKKARRVKSSR